MPTLEIAELILLSGVQKKARARVLRRMSDYGRFHPLTKEATKTSLAITEKIQDSSIVLKGIDR